MANKITGLFKKKPTFPKVDSVTNIEVRDLFKDLNKRLTKVEETLETLVNKK